MGLYCGVDLHSNNHVVTVIDEGDHRLYEKRHPNELASTLGVLERFRGELVGVAVESTFNWYWLVDGLMDAGFPVQLVNTTAVQQYSGLKHSDDWHDAFWLAHLMRLGILPTGYIYPKAQRGIVTLRASACGSCNTAAPISSRCRTRSGARARCDSTPARSAETGPRSNGRRFPIATPR